MTKAKRSPYNILCFVVLCRSCRPHTGCLALALLPVPSFLEGGSSFLLSLPTGLLSSSPLSSFTRLLSSSQQPNIVTTQKTSYSLQLLLLLLFFFSLFQVLYTIQYGTPGVLYHQYNINCVSLDFRKFFFLFPIPTGWIFPYYLRISLGMKFCTYVRIQCNVS